MATRGTMFLLPPLGHDAALYAPLVRELEGELDGVCLDSPGFGADALAFDFEAPGLLERLAGYFAAHIIALGRAPLGLGGVSLGGTLSVRVAHLLASKPSQLFLMGSGGLPVARIRRDTVRFAMHELGAQGFARQHLGLDAEELESSSLRQHLGVVTADVQAYFVHYYRGIWGPERFAQRARAAVAMLDAALDVDYRAEMAESAGRAHVIWGEQDRVFGHKFIARLSAAFPRAELHTLHGIGHYAPLEAPRRVAEIVRAAVRDQGET